MHRLEMPLMEDSAAYNDIYSAQRLRAASLTLNVGRRHVVSAPVVLRDSQFFVCHLVGICITNGVRRLGGY